MTLNKGFQRLIRKHTFPVRATFPRAKNQPPPLRDRILGTAILAAGLALFLWLTVLLCRPILMLITNSEELARFIRSQGALGKISFLGMEILQGFLPIPLELTAAAGGYAFGRAQGFFLTICSVLISTTVIFYFTKICGRKLLNLFFSSVQQEKVLFFLGEKKRDALLWLLFLIPGTPKRLFLFSAGLLPQNFSRFLLITTLARVPSLWASSVGGHALESGNYGQAAALFLLLGGASAGGLLLYKALTK